jgi:hypothetical protein
MAIGGFWRDSARDFFMSLTPEGQEPGWLARLGLKVFGGKDYEGSQEHLAKLQTRMSVCKKNLDRLDGEVEVLGDRLEAKREEAKRLVAEEHVLMVQLSANNFSQGEVAAKLAAVQARKAEVMVDYRRLVLHRDELVATAEVFGAALKDAERRLGASAAGTPAERQSIRKEIAEARSRQAEVAVKKADTDREIAETEGVLEGLTEQEKLLVAEGLRLAEAHAGLTLQLAEVREAKEAVRVEISSIQKEYDAKVAQRDDARREFEWAELEYKRRQAEFAAERKAEERRLLEKAYQEKRYEAKYLEMKRDEKDSEARRLGALYEARRLGDKDTESRHLEAVYLAARAVATGSAAVRVWNNTVEDAIRRGKAQAVRQDAVPAAERQAAAVALLAVDKVNAPAAGAEKVQLVDNASIERQRMKRERATA